MTERAEQTAPSWARWITYGSLALALGALVWTIASVGVGVLIDRLILLGAWVIVTIGIDIAVTGFDAGSIHAFLGPAKKKAGYPRVLLAQVAGRAVNVVTPLGNLGEVVKFTMLVERVPQARALVGVLLYNIVNLEISFLLIAVGAPLTAILVELPTSLEVTLWVAGAVATIAALVLPYAVWRGVLQHVVNLGRRMRLYGARAHARWSRKMADIDQKLHEAGGTRNRDRMLGVTCLVVSRALSWLSTTVLVYAAGGPISLPFLVAVITVYQVIGWVSTVVPLGIGVSEGGHYALFSALGVDPAIGVTVALGHRVVPIVYAAVGLVLASVNQTVKDVRRAHATSA